MAKDVENDIVYYMLIDIRQKEQLAGIRHWDNIKVAFDGCDVWLKDLDLAQVNSTEVRSVPYKTLYYSRNGKLCLINSQLPDRNEPSLLWSAIDRAFPIQLPSFNHNYFGVREKIVVRLIPSATEREAVCMITGVNVLQQYIEYAPAVRSKSLKWTILNNDKVLLYGTPLLPLDGSVYWQNGDHLIPAGAELELPVLRKSLESLLNADGCSFILWNNDGSYSLIDKSDLQQLSLSSFRLSVRKVLNP